MRSTLPLLALAALLLFPIPARAEEEEPLVTDRPDIAESAVTVGSGRVQLETGVLFERFRDDGSTVVSTPTLLRVGTGPDTELRLETNGHAFHSDGSRGLADVAVGAKVNLLDEESVAVGLLVDVLLPTGSSAFRGPAAEPAAKVLVDAAFSDGWGLGFNAGLAVPEDDATRHRFLQGGFALAVGRSVSEEVRLYGEVSGLGPDAAGGSFLVLADAGMTYLVNPDLQLDLSVLRGLSSGGLDWGVSAGLSARF